MLLFSRKRSVAALGDEAVDSIRQELHDVLEIAASYDQVALRNDRMFISLEGRIRGDLLAFVLYLSGVDKGLDMREILVVNRIFDIDLSHVDFQLFAKDVDKNLFETAVPPSALLLVELGNELQRAQMRKADGSDSTMLENVDGMSVLSKQLCADLINAYALIGSAFISADATVTERESEELIRYLYMIVHALFGPTAELPPGPAQRTLAAHRRLFGKNPKIRN